VCIDAVLEFTAFGEPFDDLDLWARWRVATGQAASAAAP
jgi:hypothetical protein